LNFDYTYFAFGRFLVFEPLIIVTNVIFFVICYACYRRLGVFRHGYGTRMGLFTLWTGISSLFGAAAHAIHYQLGDESLKVIVYAMNACSLIAIYFCFRGSYTYSAKKNGGSLLLVRVVKGWVLALLIAAAIYQNFVLIKIHAGLVLTYALLAHIVMHGRNRWSGNISVITGIVVSFFSIIVHTLKFSLHEWFNYKDIAHVIMIGSLLLLWKGMREISEKLSEGMTKY
jgi:hypothetical protein